MWLAERNYRGEAVMPFFELHSYCVVPQTELELATEGQKKELRKLLGILDRKSKAGD